MQNAVIRRSMVFYGWVQGVGFRWRARNAADAVGATGWVRNNFDGSVSMELQGTEAQLDAVLRAVERGSYVKIENMCVKTIPAVKNEAGFFVRDDE